MPIAPITGKLRRRLILDFSFAMVLGVTSGYSFWYGHHLKKMAVAEEHYLKLERGRMAAAA